MEVTIKVKGNAATVAKKLKKKFRQEAATLVAVNELLYIRRKSIFKCVNIDATIVAVVLYVEWNLKKNIALKLSKL